MVFVCPTKEDSEAITQMSQQIKDALKNMDQQLNIGVKPICVPCCIPLCDYPSASQEKKQENMVFDPPQVMVSILIFELDEVVTRIILRCAIKNLATKRKSKTKVTTKILK